MNMGLAPRPANEELRAQTVVKTGLIDAPNPDLFQIYCDLAKDITGFETASFSLYDGEMKCSIAEAGGDNFVPGSKSERSEWNVCSYVMLDSEPLIMEEHNRILKLLIEKGNTQVRLIYNTNLTELKYKRESVLELWKHFPSVCVAASLDDMGERAAVIRSGTDWAQVEQNIRDLKRECPHIDFMISPTLSMMNIWNFGFVVSPRK